jgi:oligopeptide transport system permease protein
VARYLLGRLLTAIPTLLVIATLAFALLHSTPGGPFDSDRQLVPQIQHSIEARYHLNDPVWLQFAHYLRDLARGDLGPSFQYRNTSVNELIAQGLPVDLAIGSTALLIALLVGGTAGLLAATRPGSWRDRLAMSAAMLGMSVPVFVTAPLLILVFALRLHWLPAGDWVAGSWRHLLLPSVALAMPYCAYIARIVRAAAIDALSQPYIRTALAKGLPPGIIVWRHASRATLMPLVSFLGPALAGVLTGSIVVEQVFGLPGIGRLFVTGALNRDYTVVTGITVLYGALIIGFNLLADLCYAWLDPRIRSRA